MSFVEIIMVSRVINIWIYYVVSYICSFTVRLDLFIYYDQNPGQQKNHIITVSLKTYQNQNVHRVKTYIRSKGTEDHVTQLVTNWAAKKEIGN